MYEVAIRVLTLDTTILENLKFALLHLRVDSPHREGMPHYCRFRFYSSDFGSINLIIVDATLIFIKIFQIWDKFSYQHSSPIWCLNFRSQFCNLLHFLIICLDLAFILRDLFWRSDTAFISMGYACWRHTMEVEPDLKEHGQIWWFRIITSHRNWGIRV